MKIIKIINHPFFLVASFLLVLISGQHLGGFYLMYILLGLPYGAVHSLMALVGIGILLFSYFRYKMSLQNSVELILNIGGCLLLMLSLYLFFRNDEEKYNYSTFQQTMPVITLIVLSIVLLNFLIRNIIRLKLILF
jgi:hypothetical protein